jgi:hypothetical protein
MGGFICGEGGKPMTAFQKSLVYGLSVVLMISTITFQAVGQEAPAVRDEAHEAEGMSEPDSAGLIFPEALGSLTGITSAGTGSACTFPPPPAKSSFTRGESVWFNVYWTDTAEGDGLNSYNVTIAVQAGTLLFIDGPGNRNHDTSAFPPGTPLTFCRGVKRTIPSSAPLSSFPWGARVIKNQDNTQAQGQLSTIVIQSGPRR